MSAVKAALDPAAYVAATVALAPVQGFRTETFAEIDGCPLVALTRRSPEAQRPHVYLSTGIHGDEPAPPAALLQLLETGTFNDQASWSIIPMLNPAGFRRGTRENAEGLDLNRDYRHLLSPEVGAHVRWLRRQSAFDVAFSLHEDWESLGFYLYELNSENRPSLSDAMLAAARRHSPIDGSVTIDGRESAAPGIIRPVSDPAVRDLWPESIYLRAHHAPLCYALETCSSFPLEQRIATMRAAVDAGLREFLR